ncbi:MAG: hypothetical protein AVDCRST_MAG72-2051 [uncultured Nocardioidaceae bacterium]|uniref:Uncharacterized protein n=1 Tax=uncultured Nocardioidaceae bacterium TaxID=253824 RepID=A0A6J4MHJ3_9ACTN|nr:MAG: hypothetical protein AVDCRST_MAG72-2051 [uncultured Nocardioidaceae bacterium]
MCNSGDALSSVMVGEVAKTGVRPLLVGFFEGVGCVDSVAEDPQAAVQLIASHRLNPADIEVGTAAQHVTP